jgi:hypothetical protein
MTMSYKFINGKFRRTIVGDIHGCWTELDVLLRKAEWGKNDLLISVGDFLDRGLSSWRVASFFRDHANAHSVLGNHERRVSGTIRGTSLPAWTQRLTVAQVPQADLPGWADYIGSLPAVIETEHAIVTHARLDTGRPLTDQEPYYTAGVGRSVRPEAVPHESWQSLFLSEGMKNPTPRIQMIDGFNEGWIEFEAGETGSRKGQIEMKTVLKTLIERETS